MTIEEFMCTWDIYPVFDYDGEEWKLDKLCYIMDDYCPCSKIGFNQKDITRIFWMYEDIFQKDKPKSISGWIKWLDERMENFYKTKCTYKTNNPYIDNLLIK